MVRLKELILDEDGYEFLSQLTNMRLFKNTRNGYWYIDFGKERRLVALHRYLVQAKPGEMIDHVNGNKDDNRHANLRRCSKQTNALNARKRPSRSPYRGVTKNTGVDTYTARACKRYLGSFKTQEEAARAYDAYMLEHHPDFARLNFPKKSG